MTYTKEEVQKAIDIISGHYGDDYTDEEQIEIYERVKYFRALEWAASQYLKEKQRREAAEEVLKWYADKEQYAIHSKPMSGGHLYYTPVKDVDKGQRAREFLEMKE